MGRLALIGTHVCALIVGWFLGTTFHSCNRTVTTGATGTGSREVIETSARTDTVIRETILYRDRWHTRTMSVAVYDTLRPPVASYPYIRRAQATTVTADTIDVAYHHPDGEFDIDFRPHPDTVRTITIATDSIVLLREAKKWGLGFHAGFGVQRGGGGVLRAGVLVGVGVNFNLWEP